MSGFAWAAFASGLAGAAGAALAVMLVTFAIALKKGVHRIVDVAWASASPPSPWCRTASRRAPATTPAGCWSPR